MHKGPNILAILLIVGTYLTFIGLIVFYSIRLQKKRIAARADALSKALAAVGGKEVGAPTFDGMYGHASHQYDVGGRHFLCGTGYFTRYNYRAFFRGASQPMPFVTVYPEKMMDRIGKAIGLSREVQTGDEKFDELAYVDSNEDDAVVKALFEQSAVRDAVRQLLDLGFKVQFSREGVEAFKIIPYGQLPNFPRAESQLAILAQLIDALPTIAPSTFKGDNKGKQWGMVAAMLGWIPFAVFAGLLHGIFQNPGGRTLHEGPFGLVIIIGALSCWLVYVGTVGFTFRGRSQGFRTTLVSGVLALFTLPLFGIITMLTLNQSLDSSPAETQYTTVLQKKSYKNERTLYVSSWASPGASVRLPISSKFFERYNIGTKLTVQTHQGAFGLPWVEPLGEPPAK